MLNIQRIPKNWTQNGYINFQRRQERVLLKAILCHVRKSLLLPLGIPETCAGLVTSVPLKTLGPYIAGLQHTHVLRQLTELSTLPISDLGQGKHKMAVDLSSRTGPSHMWSLTRYIRGIYRLVTQNCLTWTVLKLQNSYFSKTHFKRI